MSTFKKKFQTIKKNFFYSKSKHKKSTKRQKMSLTPQQILANKTSALLQELNKPDNFKSNCATKVDPFFWLDVKEQPLDWKQVMAVIKQSGTPNAKISNVTFENDEASLATLATVDVVLEVANAQCIVVRFVKAFKLYLSDVVKRTASIDELSTLMTALGSIREFSLFVNMRADKKGRVMFAAMDANGGNIGVISNVAAKGKSVTFVVTKHPNMMGGPQVRRLAVKADASRVSPDGRHLVVQTGPQSWSVFEVQPALQKFELSQVDIQELQRILELQK